MSDDDDDDDDDDDERSNRQPTNLPQAIRGKDRRDAGRALLVGAVLAVLGAAVTFSPLIWGRSFAWNKYFVVCGLALTLLGAGMMLNGGFDWLRSKR